MAEDVLAGLDELDWSTLHGAYGPAGSVPILVRGLIASDAGVRARALTALWDTVWHQGTVYDCTPRVVPFLAAVVSNKGGADATRAQVALLLASIAWADSFVLPGPPHAMLPAAWRRELTEAAPSRDVTVESSRAVARRMTRFLKSLAAAPAATRAALLTVMTAAGPAEVARALAALQTFASDPDPRLTNAARIGELLLRDALTEETLIRFAAVDDDVADYLRHLTGWPLNKRAADVVQELVVSALDRP